MDYIGATPQSNPIMGLLAERLKQAQQFATRPFGYQNPPAEMLLNLLGIPAVQQTAERLAYGEPLTTGRGMTTQIRPEVAEAALTVAPVAGLLGRGAEKAAIAAGRAGERYAERVVPQIMEKGGMPAQLLQDLSQGSIRPMDVWHGSPHGPFEKFDPTKIGSGEGAQAFSYGHYLGEARGTGEQYRDMLKQKQFAKIVEKGRNDFDVIAPDGTVLAEGVYRGAAQKVYDNFNKEAGYLYKVELPDEAIANMLDWDKPLSKQPEKVKNWLKDTYNPYKAELTAKDIGGNEPTGSLIYNRLQELMSEGKKSDVFSNQSNYGAQNASRELAEYGIPGVRYLDEGSRAAGKGTSNFVVFPGGEDLLTIKEINDKPVGGLLGQSKAAEVTDLLSYRGSHTAPGPDFGAPLYDLTGGGQMYPADVYSPKAAQYYGTGYPKADKEAFALANKVRGNPDAEVTMYRAVPNNENIKEINAGDWVTLSKDYAKNHGESVLDNDYKIISKKVKAKDLWTNADSIHEFGYWPELVQSKAAFTYPQEEAMRLAQQRAALPVEQGGLGLAADNTAAERAAAMGFDTDLLHGTAQDFPAFDLNKAGTNTREIGDELGIFSTAKPFLANSYAEIAAKGGWANRTEPTGAVVYPLKANLQSPKRFERATDFYREADPRAAEQSLGNWRNELQGQGYDSVIVRPDMEEVVAFNPDQLRSRFAAFDPFRRNAAIAAAMGVAAPNLLAEEQKPKKKRNLLD